MSDKEVTALLILTGRANDEILFITTCNPDSFNTVESLRIILAGPYKKAHKPFVINIRTG